jgi:hypothetical protein
MRGKCSASPVQLASAASAPAKPAAPPAFEPSLTALEYQPIRVLMSVLLTAVAATRISTSPGFGCGTGTSVRYSSTS